MLRSVERLGGFTILATDGEIGKVDEFYFDDETWAIRYLVVTTGPWLLRRKVLIHPSAVGQINWGMQMLSVGLTKKQVKNSPDIDTDQPISRQHEVELFRHYNWVPYWTSGGGFAMQGGVAVPVIREEPPAKSTVEKEIEAMTKQTRDPSLRSTNEVIGYHIQAGDGEIGHVEDFLVDEEGWIIRYLIIDTRNWLPGRSVLVTPRWIEMVTWNEKKVHVDLSKEAIKNSPEYDPTKPLSRAYEETLHKHYDRPIYWS